MGDWKRDWGWDSFPSPFLLHFTAKHLSCGPMKYQILSINHDNRSVTVSYKDQHAEITFHECGEVDVDSDEMQLEDIQELHTLACEDEQLSNIFPCED